MIFQGAEKKLCLCNGIGGYKLDGCNNKKINVRINSVLLTEHSEIRATYIPTIQYTTSKIFKTTTTEETTITTIYNRPIISFSCAIESTNFSIYLTALIIIQISF